MLMPYSPSAEPLTRLADGTVKQISPFTGTEVWTVPGRANRPISHPVAEVRPLEEADRTHSCAFCSARYLETPPEKARLVRGADGGFERLDAVAASPPSSLATVVMLAPETGFLPLAARDHRLIRVNPGISEEKLLAAVDRTLWADTGDLALDWVFIALETSATKAVRRHLIASGLSRRSIQHQGYWTRGRAMGTTPEA